MTSAACFRALLAFCSPSAAITWRNGKMRIFCVTFKKFLNFSDLCSRLPGSLSLSSHGSLQVNWQSNIFSEDRKLFTIRNCPETPPFHQDNVSNKTLVWPSLYNMKLLTFLPAPLSLPRDPWPRPEHSAWCGR